MKKNSGGVRLFVMSVLVFFVPIVFAEHALPAPLHQQPAHHSRQDEQQRVTKFLNSLTPDEHSVLKKRLSDQARAARSGFGVSLFEPTYILPFYYTGSTYSAPYRNPNGTLNTPDGQDLMNEEFKAQFSFMFPLWQKILGSHFSLNASYTQLMFWQVFAKSQYFRETNYEPALFVSDHFLPNWLASAGVVHQSNGRGGSTERSWNRMYADVSLSGDHWIISFKPWILIFTSDSSDVHNPNIATYLGYERIVFAYKFHHQVLSLNLRNTIESGFKRSAIEVDYSFPIHGQLKGFVQLFSGYGQSLIEYDHYANAIGFGVGFNNWI